MAKTPSPADTAKVIIDALVTDLGLRVGQAVPLRELKARTRARGVHDEDLVAGLNYAENKENWIEVGRPQGFIRLTDPGFAAASPKQHYAPFANHNPVAGKVHTSSHGQSGGITAQTVNFYTPAPPAQPAAEKSRWWTSGWWVGLLGVMTILGGLVPTLEHFHIEWPRQLEQKQSPVPAMLPAPTQPKTEIPVETETLRLEKAAATSPLASEVTLNDRDKGPHPSASNTAGPWPLNVRIVGSCKHAGFSEQSIRAAILSNLESDVDARSIIVKIVGGTENGISEGTGTSVRAYGNYTLCRGDAAQDCPDPPLECDTWCRYSSGDSLTINRELATDGLGQAIARKIASVPLTQTPARGAICGS